MPYLQLDTTACPSPEARADFALAMARCYARHMDMDIRRVSVAVRVLGPDGLFRVIDDRAVPAHLLMCDIRRGRDVETRRVLAEALLAVCEDALGLARDRVNLEFTQHTGDEMYHPTLNGFSPEWQAPSLD